jgi:hypothetical protein
MEKLLRYIGKDIQKIDLLTWLYNKPQELHPLVKMWLTEIQKCGKDVQIIFHDNYPIGCVNHAPFVYVNAFKAHVNVGFFYGAELPDTTGLMEGTGKRMRHIKLTPGLEKDEKEIKSLIQSAYLDIKQRL